jgi:hypothetical protein
VLCGLAGHPEVARAAELGLPVVAFDGVQGGAPVPDCSLMFPFTPDDDMGGTTAAARAATLISEAAAGGARCSPRSGSRARSTSTATLSTLYRAGADWALTPDRPR